MRMGKASVFLVFVLLYGASLGSAEEKKVKQTGTFSSLTYNRQLTIHLIHPLSNSDKRRHEEEFFPVLTFRRLTEETQTIRLVTTKASNRLLRSGNGSTVYSET